MTPREQLEAYAGFAWGPEDLVEVRPLPAARDDARRWPSRWVRAEALPGMAEDLARINGEGANIYAGTLPRTREGGAKDADAGPGRVVWADFDGTDPRAAWKRARGAGLLEPGMAVSSGHGAHIFWGLTAPATPAEISGLVGDLAALLGTDPSVKNPSRILRLPGFKNHKPPPADAVLLFADPERRHAFADLRAGVPAGALPRPGGAAGNGHPAPGGTREHFIERARRYVATVPGSGPGGRTHAAFKVAAVLVNDYGLTDAEARPILGGWDTAANSPTIASEYGPGKIQEILENAHKYAKKPPGTKATGGFRVQAAATIPLPAACAGSDTHAAEGGLLRAEFEAEGRGERATIPLPFPRLSNITNALRPGTVTVLGGPSGHGKSLLALEIAVHVHRQAFPWAWLPLEDRKADFERRLLAFLSGSWDPLSTEAGAAADRVGLLERHGEELGDLARHVTENPRLPTIGADGKPTVPPLPYPAVLEWIGEALKTARVVFVDPWTQIDFGEGSAQWAGEKDFIRRAVALAARAGGSLVIVAHAVKRPGRAGTLPLTGEDLQGAAELKRLTHTVILLEAHDERDSEILLVGGSRKTVKHKWTVLVDKVRNGDGRGIRIALTMDGPRFEELGSIAPRR